MRQLRLSHFLFLKGAWGGMEFDVKSNDCLLNLNMSRATKEQKIQWLCQIIDNEVDKPEEEQDFALINEASDYLRELTEGDAR